ncbi:hypothetical protein, partial [Tahibacter harae]
MPMIAMGPRPPPRGAAADGAGADTAVCAGGADGDAAAGGTGAVPLPAAGALTLKRCDTAAAGAAGA